MTEERSHLLAGAQAEISRLWDEVRASLSDRLELVQLELGASAKAIRRLLFVLIPAALLTLLSLPLLIVALATAIDGWLGLAGWGWMLIFAGVFVGGAGASGALAYVRFRRDFCGLKESLEELREDLVWLREWTAEPEAADGETDD